MKKSIRILLVILCLVFIGIFAYSGYRLLDIVRDYRVSEKKYTQLSGQYVSSAPVGGSDNAAVSEERSPIGVDFSLLLQQNGDVAAWIYSPDTPINYPVVHGADNEYYLNHFIDGTVTDSGTPFIDCLCTGDFSDQNTVIYGHHMKDGSIFASLSNYGSAGYYEAHPCLYLNTPAQNYRIEVFSGYMTEPDSDSYIFDFSEESDYLDFLQRMRAKSDFPSSVELGPDDRIVTLSTCTYEHYDARYVIQGKLVPIN